MVLESDIECLSKAIHVVVLGDGGKDEYNVGRRINNDITVSDISVSRKQATFRLREGNKIFVEDCDSKFGTFVKVRGPFKIQRGEKLPLQIEKKCFFIKIENRFSCLQKCLLGCQRRTDKSELYDHYIDVKEKFPKELEKHFLGSKFMGKGSGKKNGLVNRIVDESVVTHLSVAG